MQKNDCLYIFFRVTDHLIVITCREFCMNVTGVLDPDRILQLIGKHFLKLNFSSMKKVLVFTISLMISFGLYSQDKGVFFQDITLKEAIEKAKHGSGPDLIFVDCYTDWCGPCKNMTNNVFPLEECGVFFNSNFINVKFDMEKGEGLEIAKKYSVSVYPTFLILDPEGNEINRVIGGDSPSRFIEKVKIAMDPSSSPSAKLDAYNKDNSSENLYAYVKSLRSSYKNDQLNAFIGEVFFALKPSEKYNEVIWGALISPTGDMRNTNSDIFKYVISNRFEAEEFITKSKLDASLIQTLKYYFMSYISGNLPNEMHTAYERNIICANALFTGDFGMKYLTTMAALKSQDKMEELFGMLDYRTISRSTSLDIELIEKSFTQMKVITPDQKSKIVKYLQDKHAALTREADYAKRKIEASL
ncbi:Thiol:disulfide interchange protein DsbD [bioreactor metagenome]|uniref:Thiol:disulfide interchange protein DsbD n=1 Tax=bioreactor metagenome TaxID=1076179 RepID=A0A644YSD0_9ZZZZ